MHTSLTPAGSGTSVRWPTRAPESTTPVLRGLRGGAPHALPAAFDRAANEADAVRIAVADSPALRRDAAALLERRYRWRGYGVVGLPTEPQPRRCTFTALAGDEVIGTLTVGLDRAGGLACDALFGTEVDALRLQGLHVCEFKRLAVDGDHADRSEALTRLFHSAFTHARFRHRVDVVLTEVNPRHVDYYAQRFGARVLARPRRHAGVGAPAVLLMLDLAALQVTAERLASAVDMPRRVLS
jgi:hypothetical protein